MPLRLLYTPHPGPGAAWVEIVVNLDAYADLTQGEGYRPSYGAVEKEHRLRCEPDLLLPAKGFLNGVLVEGKILGDHVHILARVEPFEDDLGAEARLCDRWHPPTDARVDHQLAATVEPEPSWVADVV